MRGDLTSPEITLLLLGGVSMNYKAYKRNLLKLDYEQVKFDWEEEELRAVKRRRGRSGDVAEEKLPDILFDINNYE